MSILPAEYKERAERARRLMREQGIAALMVTGDYLFSSNYRYLTGHTPRDYQATADRTNVLILTPESSAICAHPGGKAAARATWVDEVFTYTPQFRHTDLLPIFQKLGVTGGKVAAELGDDQRMMLQIAEYERLKAALPGIEWVDIGPVLWPLRMVKSPAEIELIRAGDRINLAALQSIFAKAHEGMTARQLRALAAAELAAAGAVHPPHTQINFAATSKTKGPDGFVLAKGDMLFIDTGVVHQGYWAEFNRTAVVGPPSETQERWHAMARRINERWWTEILKPGVTAEAAILRHIEVAEAEGLDAHQSGRDVLTSAPFPHHAHSIGMHSSEPPRLRIGEKTAFEAGMVINVETYIFDGDTRYACEEDVLITPTGAEPLSAPDTHLYVIA